MTVHRTEHIDAGHGRFVRMQVVAASRFEGRTRDAVIGLKYRNERRNALVLAGLVAPLLAEPMVVAPFDILTWVPTADTRKRERGIDHAELIARHAGVLAGVRTARLLRRVGTSQQTGAARSVRLAGPAFVAHARCAGLRVAVLDDVVTTGATLRAACGALVGAGAVAVTGLAVADVG
jgi:predicted amidophosphoribosyltransferase